MLQFLVRRIATIVPTLVFVSMLIFGLQQLLPGDPAVILAGEERDENVVAYLREKLHLDESVRTQQPVLDLIVQKLPVTVELAMLAMAIALTIGIPAGIVSAVGRG